MFQYTPRQIPSKVVVIGCGGTGSRLIPMLAQFLRSITREANPLGWLQSPTIYLVDFDTVEHKNLLRQNFVAADVGKHKASVLAQRYGRAYDMNIVPILKRVEKSTTPDALFEGIDIPGGNLLGTMFIMCVDSSDARRNILGMIERIRISGGYSQSSFVIDAGNENNYGQVKFFNMAKLYGSKTDKRFDIPKNVPTIHPVEFIPYDKDFYTSLQDAPSQGSCADLDQTLAINALMATTIMGVVQNFFYVKPFQFNEVSISLDGGSYTTFNTFANFRNRCCSDTSGSQGVIDSVDIFNPYARAVRADLDKINRAMAEAEAEAKREMMRKEADAATKEAREKGKDKDEGSEVEVEPAIESTPKRAAKRVSPKKPSAPLEVAPPREIPRDLPPLVQIR